jgi:transposase
MRQIAKKMGVSKKRVCRVIRNEKITKPKTSSILKPYERLIDQWYQEYPFLKASQVYGRLKAYEFKGSYTTVSVYTQKHRQKKRQAYHELTFLPGEAVQIDWIEERLPWGAAYGFAMILAYSRYLYVRFYPRQNLEFFLEGHIEAYREMGGVAHRHWYDNIKTVVIERSPELKFNAQFLDFARHFGFSIHLCNPYRANEKGKVERGVPVVRKHLLAGRSFRDVEETNQRALRWCKEEIGMEVHGTTKRKPFEVFQKEEAPYLKPLPSEPFECPEWKKCTVHPDHHIVFDKSYYSLPTRWIGEEVWGRGTRRLVQIFCDEQLIKTHIRAEQPGTWVTDSSDYPPEKLAYLMPTPTYCRKKAFEIGPHTGALVEEILRDHAMKNLRKAQALLRLADKHGRASMEAAAERALFFGNFRYQSIKTILEKGWFSLEQAPPSPTQIPLSPLGQRFLRPPEYFASGEGVIS